MIVTSCSTTARLTRTWAVWCSIPSDNSVIRSALMISHLHERGRIPPRVVQHSRRRVTIGQGTGRISQARGERLFAHRGMCAECNENRETADPSVQHVVDLATPGEAAGSCGCRPARSRTDAPAVEGHGGELVTYKRPDLLFSKDDVRPADLLTVSSAPDSLSRPLVRPRVCRLGDRPSKRLPEFWPASLYELWLTGIGADIAPGSSGREARAAVTVSRSGSGRGASADCSPGLGNFFRAHECWYTEHARDAADWGIAAFTGTAATTWSTTSIHKRACTRSCRAPVTTTGSR